jgi:hypothetical protein
LFVTPMFRSNLHLKYAPEEVEVGVVVAVLLGLRSSSDQCRWAGAHHTSSERGTDQPSRSAH